MIEDLFWKSEHDIAKEEGLSKGMKLAACESGCRNVSMTVKVLDDQK